MTESSSCRGSISSNTPGSSPRTTRPARSTPSRPTAATPVRSATTTRCTAPTTRTSWRSSAGTWQPGPHPPRPPSHGPDLDTAPPPSPARVDRHGIPNPGPCIRCNLQLEGSGVSADDVVVEAGDAAAGNGGPSAVGNAKDVGIFIDRADGFVLRNLTVRHAREHDIYMLETDGYLLDSFKTFYAGGYGVLTFVEDHGVMQNCEAAGNGDSGIYPGSGAPTTLASDRAYYPDAPRYSQEIRNCDIHHNTGGFSGTDSHGTLVDHNNFYGNALGFTTDVFTAAGHPGFPQGGNLVKYNDFYSNNFNPYLPGSPIHPAQPEPVGTGLWIAGGNDNVIRYNHFYDNWRRGT